MKIISRHFLVLKSAEEVRRIITSSACHFAKVTFDKECFTMYGSKRYNGGNVSIFPIKGMIRQIENKCEVSLYLCADFGFLIGACICLLGFYVLFSYFVSDSTRWIPAIGMIFAGLMIMGHSLSEGVDIINRLQSKLIC